mmetsp:Transcript_98664/g.284701  ORF Transcript_98664/g.284701 Transcript_98664/m.284701 type:complete len:240 (+) Transcript_98664:163-882(+)
MRRLLPRDKAACRAAASYSRSKWVGVPLPHGVNPEGGRAEQLRDDMRNRLGAIRELDVDQHHGELQLHPGCVAQAKHRAVRRGRQSRRPVRLLLLGEDIVGQHRHPPAAAVFQACSLHQQETCLRDGLLMCDDVGDGAAPGRIEARAEDDQVPRLLAQHRLKVVGGQQPRGLRDHLHSPETRLRNLRDDPLAHAALVGEDEDVLLLGRRCRQLRHIIPVASVADHLPDLPAEGQTIPAL